MLDGDDPPENGAESVKAAKVPTISLIHEFPSYARPSLAFPAFLALATETVFSTRMTLEDAVANLRLDPGAYIHMAPQGKGIVPATPDLAKRAHSWTMNCVRGGKIRRRWRR